MKNIGLGTRLIISGLLSQIIVFLTIYMIYDEVVVNDSLIYSCVLTYILFNLLTTMMFIFGEKNV